MRWSSTELAVLILLTIVAIAAPLIAPYPPSYGDPVLAPPSGAHWFGTDSLGRDVFGEVVWGSQQSILVAVAASAIAIVVGTIVGAIMSISTERRRKRQSFSLRSCCGPSPRSSNGFAVSVHRTKKSRTHSRRWWC